MAEPRSSDDVLNEIRRKRGIGTDTPMRAVDPDQPTIRPAERVDLQELEQDTKAAARDSFSLSEGPDEAAAHAAAWTRNVAGTPETMPNKPTYEQQFKRSFGQTSLVQDNRDDKLVDQVGALLDARAGKGSILEGSVPGRAAVVARDFATAQPEIGYALGSAGVRKAAELGGVAPEKVPEFFRQDSIGAALSGLFGLDTDPSPPAGQGEAAADGDPDVDPSLKGIPTENVALALLRAASTTGSAIVQESINRIPLPEFLAKPGEGSTVPDTHVPGDVWTVGEVFTGVPVNAQQRYRRGSYAGDWAQGILERIEDGRGWEGDFALAAKNHLGPEYETAGWWTGMLLDTITNWEGALLSGPSLVAHSSRVAAGLDALSGTRVPNLPHAWAAIAGNEVDVAAEIGDRIAGDIVAGRMTLDQAPPALRARFDQVAMNKYGMTFREVLEADGVKVGAAPGVDAEFVKSAADTADAKQLARAAESAKMPEAAPAAPVPSTPQPEAQAAAPPKGKSPEKLKKRAEQAQQDLKDAEQLIAESQARLEELRKTDAGVAPAAPPPGGESPRGAESVAKGKKKPKLPPSKKAIADEEAFLADATKFRDRYAEDLRKAVEAWKAAPPPPPRPVKPKPEGTPGVDPGVFAERPKAEIHGPREKIRPTLPDFGQGAIVNTMVDYWRQVERLYKGPDVHPLGYDMPPSIGFNRFTDANRMSVEDKLYTVRNMAGDVIGDAVDFRKALANVLKRQLDGDSIWYDGTKRRVAGWSAKEAAGKGEPKLSADHLFASDAERLLVKDAATNDPRAIPARLRQLQADAELRASRQARKTIGGELLRKLTGAPPKPPPSVSATRTAEVIRGATDLAATDLLGSSTLKALGNGALVSPRDHARINRDVDQLLGYTGPEARVNIEHGGHDLTDATRAVHERLVPGSRTQPLTAELYFAARRAALDEVGGVLADARYRVQGMLPLGEKLIRTLSDPHINRHNRAGIAKAVSESLPVRLGAKMFTENVLGRMPTQVRELWQGLKTTIALNADDLARLVEDELKAGGNALEVMTRIVQRYPTIHPDDLAQASRILGDELSMTRKATLDELRTNWRGARPEWLDDPHDIVAMSGARAWARDTEETAADVARDWLRSLEASGAKRGEGAGDLAGEVAQLKTEQLLPLYNEAIVRGETNGPVSAALRSQLHMGEFDETKALVAFALRIRISAAVGKIADQLIDAGGAIRVKDVRLPALRSVLEDKARVWNGERWEYKHTEAQVTWALNRLEDWGIEPGANTKIVTSQLGHTAVKIPEFLAQEIDSILKSGALEGSSWEKASIGVIHGKLMRYYKEGITHGFVVPIVPYFLGQLTGMLPTLVVTRGWKGAADTILSASSPFRYPLLVGELVKRAGGYGHPLARVRTAEGRMLQTVSGDLVSVEQMEAAIRRHGLHETRAAFEVQTGLMEVLRNADRSWYNPLKLAKSARWWQEIIRKVAGTVDLNARIATFVDMVEKGMPLDTAAIEAKKSVLDFRDLTHFEQHYARLVVTFYAFLRKNADAHVRALLTHPERVISQMRLAHASITHSGLTNIELGQMRDQDVGRLAFSNDEEVVNDQGRVHPLYRMNRVTSPPISVVDWLMQMRMLTVYDQNAKDELLSSLTLPFQLAAIWLQGRKLDREFDSPRSNRIPPVVVDLLPSFVLDTFGIGWAKLEPMKGDDPLIRDEDASHEAGADAIWVAGAPSVNGDPGWQAQKRKLWQTALLFLQRPITEAQLASEALGFRPPPPHMLQIESTRDLLLGTKTLPVPRETAVIEKWKRGKAGRLEDAARDIRNPDGVGPR